MHAHIPYSVVFLLHAPAPTSIKIGFGAVRCYSCSCVGEDYRGSIQLKQVFILLYGARFFFFFSYPFYFFHIYENVHGVTFF